MSSATIWWTESGALRAPWQIGVFGLVVSVISVLLGGLIYSLLLLTPAVGWARIARIPLDQWIQVACVLASTTITARLLGRSDMWSYVAFDRRAWNALAVGTGAVLGAAVVGIPALLFVATGVARFEPSTSTESGLFMAWGALALLVPAALTEELLFRGFAFAAARDAIGTWWTVIVTSVCFGLAHILNPDPSVTSVVAVVVAGVFLATVRLATGSLVAAFIAHLGVNFTQLVILHAPVSGQAFDTPGYRLLPTGPEWLTGGAWGPEGGVGAIAAMLVATFLMTQKTDDRGQKTVLK